MSKKSFLRLKIAKIIRDHALKAGSPLARCSLEEIAQAVDGIMARDLQACRERGITLDELYRQRRAH